jgi:hypothetical protein
MCSLLFSFSSVSPATQAWPTRPLQPIQATAPAHLLPLASHTAAATWSPTAEAHDVASSCTTDIPPISSRLDDTSPILEDGAPHVISASPFSLPPVTSAMKARTTVGCGPHAPYLRDPIKGSSRIASPSKLIPPPLLVLVAQPNPTVPQASVASVRVVEFSSPF